MRLVRDTTADDTRYFIEFADGKRLCDTKGKPHSFPAEEARQRMFHGQYAPPEPAPEPAKPPQAPKPEKAKEE